MFYCSISALIPCRLPTVRWLARGTTCLASCRVSPVLGLEGALRPTRTSHHFARGPSPDPQDVSIDFFTVPTIRFQVLYVFLVLAHDRRRILHFNVTAHPTAEWTGQQLREAFPFDQLPR